MKNTFSGIQAKKKIITKMKLSAKAFVCSLGTALLRRPCDRSVFRPTVMIGLVCC